MEIKGMEHFQDVCRQKLVEWYQKNRRCANLSVKDTYVVWSCKTLQNYKLLASTTLNGDHVYAEYTYNGDKKELYEDVYDKLTNTCYSA